MEYVLLLRLTFYKLPCSVLHSAEMQSGGHIVGIGPVEGKNSQHDKLEPPLNLPRKEGQHVLKFAAPFYPTPICTSISSTKRSLTEGHHCQDC
jgi:hypothetical protein